MSSGYSEVVAGLVDTLAAVLAMKDTQSYHVTPWQASAFYGERSTYVYHAAVRAPGDEGAVAVCVPPA